MSAVLWIGTPFAPPFDSVVGGAIVMQGVCMFWHKGCQSGAQPELFVDAGYSMKMNSAGSNVPVAKAAGKLRPSELHARLEQARSRVDLVIGVFRQNAEDCESARHFTPDRRRRLALTKCR